MAGNFVENLLAVDATTYVKPLKPLRVRRLPDGR
jgi:hypothetical protein